MQRQIRFGDVHKPKGVQSIPFTLQKSYKNVEQFYRRKFKCEKLMEKTQTKNVK
jgi:hypothetical protein